jgi:hypothetical protein
MKILLLLFPLSVVAANPSQIVTIQADQYNDKVITQLIQTAVKSGKTAILISEVNQQQCSLECINSLIVAYKNQGYHYSSVLNELTNQVSLSLGWFK